MEIQTTPSGNELSKSDPKAMLYEDPLSRETDEKTRTINGFLRCVKQKDLTIRSELIDELLKYPDVATDALVIALLSDNRHARAMAAFALGEARHPRIVNILISAIRDESDEVRLWAVRSLGEIGDPVAAPHVMRGLKDESDVVRTEAACSLGKLGGFTAMEPLLQCIIEDPNERVRTWAGMSFIEIEERVHTIRPEEDTKGTDLSRILGLIEQFEYQECRPEVSPSSVTAEQTEAEGEPGAAEQPFISPSPPSRDLLLQEIGSGPLPIPATGSEGRGLSWSSEEDIEGHTGEISFRYRPLPADQGSRLIGEGKGRDLDVAGPGAMDPLAEDNPHDGENPPERDAQLTGEEWITDTRESEAERTVPCPDVAGFFESDADSGFNPKEEQATMELENIPLIREETHTEIPGGSLTEGGEENQNPLEEVESAAEESGSGIDLSPVRITGCLEGKAEVDLIPEEDWMGAESAASTAAVEKRGTDLRQTPPAPSGNSEDARIQEETECEPPSPAQTVPEQTEVRTSEPPLTCAQPATTSEDPWIREQAAVAAGSGEAPDIPTLCHLMKDREQEVRMAAKSVMAGFRERRVLDMFLDHQARDGESRRQILLSLFLDESEDLQAWSVWALGILNDEGAVADLQHLLLSGARAVQREVVRSLASLGEPGSGCLVASLHHPDPVVRADILGAVYRKGPEMVPVILHALPGMVDTEWQHSISLLASFGEKGLPHFYRALDTDDERTGFRLADLVAGLGYDALLPLLEGRERESERKRRNILRALGHCDDPRVQEPLLQSLTDPDTTIRLEALGYARDRKLTLSPYLLPWLEQEDESLRLEAVRTMGTEADSRSIVPLMKRLKDPSGQVREAVIQALGDIGDRLPNHGEGWTPSQ